MQNNKYNSLSIEQKQEYINTLTEDLIPAFISQFRDNPLQPLLQAWCSIPFHIDTIMQNSSPIEDEEKLSIIMERGDMATALTTILTNIFLSYPLAYRTPNLHLTFTNSDGSTGSIVVDNLQTSPECHIKTDTIKLVSH